MSNPFTESLRKLLKENPEHCYVTDNYIAALMGEELNDVLVITGDFKNKTPAEINQKIIDTINQITKR
jgi:hypothetical protein